MTGQGRNATRRNRNIGTSKSGHGRDNRLVIPDQGSDRRVFWEKLRDPVTIQHTIGDKDVVILVEPVIKGYTHCCTPDDVLAMLEMVPSVDLDEVRIFVLRQPKRKEAILRPVWGRMAYFAELGVINGPAVFLEAQELGRTWRQPTSMSVAQRREFDRLRADGHQFRELSNSYTTQLTVEACRAKQPYRTLPHEIGHQMDIVVSVDRPQEALDVDDSEWAAILDRYWAKSGTDKEAYAHRYADELGAQLRREGRIPFDRLVDADRLRSQGLDPAWFEAPA